MTIHIDKDLCKGCGLCVEACPTNVYAITGETNRKGFAVVTAVNAEVRQMQNVKTCPDLALYIEE